MDNTATFMQRTRRKVIRSIKDEHDKSTIVSVYPNSIEERGYSIPGGTEEHPSLVIVGASSWWIPGRDEGMPMIERPVSSRSICESIIRDYCSGLFGYAEDAMPGMFFIPKEINLIDVLKNHKDLIKIAKNKQTKYFNTLIGHADALWARSDGNPLSISDEMRLAASELNFKDKPWLQDYRNVQLTPCKFCGTLKSDTFPICQNCKQITDPVRAKELGLLESKAS